MLAVQCRLIRLLCVMSVICLSVCLSVCLPSVCVCVCVLTLVNQHQHCFSSWSSSTLVALHTPRAASAAVFAGRQTAPRIMLYDFPAPHTQRMGSQLQTQPPCTPQLPHPKFWARQQPSLNHKLLLFSDAGSLLLVAGPAGFQRLRGQVLEK